MVTLVVTVAVALPAFMSSVSASGYSPAPLTEADRQPAATAASTAQRMTRPTLVSLSRSQFAVGGVGGRGVGFDRTALDPPSTSSDGNADPTPALDRAS